MASSSSSACHRRLLALLVVFGGGMLALAGGFALPPRSSSSSSSARRRPIATTRGGGGESEASSPSSTCLSSSVEEAMETSTSPPPHPPSSRVVSASNWELLSRRGQVALSRLMEHDAEYQSQVHVYGDWPDVGIDDDGKRDLAEQVSRDSRRMEWLGRFVPFVPPPSIPTSLFFFFSFFVPSSSFGIFFPHPSSSLSSLVRPPTENEKLRNL
jgi:hypothetical protein